MRRPIAAFTLTELMVVLAVAATLSLTVMHTWTAQQERARRATARAALMAALAGLEHHHTRTGTYADPAHADAPAGQWPHTDPRASGHVLRARTCPGRNLSQCVEVAAQPMKPDADCGTLVLRSTGERSPASAACWP